MFYGLAAALGWGLADLTAAISGRRIGSMRTVLIAQLFSLVVLAAAIALWQPSLAATRTQIVILLFGGLLGAGAYLSLYRSLELGPVALVSPIVAAYASVTILLAVVLLHERLNSAEVVGTLLTLGGVMLAATDLRELRKGGALLQGGGIPWAIAAMLLFGVATYVLGRVSHDIGWAAPTLYSRIGDVAGILAVAFVMRARMGGRRPRRPDLLLAMGVGAADMLGVIAYARGAELGLISVVTAASVAFILIPVFGGLILFKERPAPSQGLGVVLVALGLLLLGLGS